MTEIALALSMGFFSILVLTMVSMGAGIGESSEGTTAILTLVPSVEAAGRSDQVDDNDTILIFYQGQYFDKNLERLDPLRVVPDGRVVLAVDPDLPMAAVMKASSPFAAGEFVVATLQTMEERK